MQHKKTLTRSSLKLDKLVNDRKFIKLDSFAAYSTEFEIIDFVSRIKRLKSHEAQSEINKKNEYLSVVKQKMKLANS